MIHVQDSQQQIVTLVVSLKVCTSNLTTTVLQHIPQSIMVMQEFAVLVLQTAILALVAQFVLLALLGIIYIQVTTSVITHVPLLIMEMELYVALVHRTALLVPVAQFVLLAHQDIISTTQVTCAYSAYHMLTVFIQLQHFAQIIYALLAQTLLNVLI